MQQSRLLVYLAPEGDTAGDPDWHSLSHQALFPVYAELVASGVDPHTHKLIEDFHRDLRRKLDTSIDAAVGAFLFSEYSSTVITRLIPSNSLWGVMALLPTSSWEASPDGSTAAERHYESLRDDASAWWPLEQWAAFPAELAEEFDRRGLDIGRPVTPDLLERVALLLWEHRPMKVVDHSTDENVRELVRRLFTHFTGADPQVVSAPPSPEFAALGEVVGITRGKGQGIQFDRGWSRYKLQGSARRQTFELLSLLSATSYASDATKDPDLQMRHTTLADWGFLDGVWDAAVMQARAAELVTAIATSREVISRRAGVA